MGRSSLLSACGLCLLVLFHGSLAQIEQVTSRGRSQQQPRLQSECQLDRLNAVHPQRRVKSEGGVSEFWDQFDDQFYCAGVAAARHRIQPRGLLLPSYSNAPELIYVVRGRGVHGVLIPGCAETFQSQSESQQQPRDQHQKIRYFREGDILALPAGTAQWIYNDGGSDLLIVKLIDVGNNANQLDQNFRRFFLAGNPEKEVVTGGQCREDESESPTESERPSQSRRCSGSQRSNGDNILSGFDAQLLAEALNIDPQLARRLQNQDDMRGAIVRVERDLQLLSPRYSEQEQEPERREEANGLEETFCTMRLSHRIDEPSRADVFNPRAGRISTVNSFNLPILRSLQLSAERGVLYRNALYTPHWNMNAHSIMYITRGNGQLQVVREDGKTVYNGRVEEGQMIVVPQHFAVVKRAGNEGLEWISFKTNSDAKISQIAGRVSVLRGIPVDVLANAYRINREEARRLKDNREEVSVLSPSSRSSRD